MRNRFGRPIFGPFRRKARTGVPADHFPPARRPHGDGLTALVADGEPAAPGLEEWWFPSTEARDAFIAGTAWAEETYAYDDDVRDRMLAELAAHGATRDRPDGDGAAFAMVRTGEVLALHAPYTGVHTHEHSHKGQKHSHSHFHQASASHNHAHTASVDLSRLGEEERRRVDAANEITDPEQLASLVASAFDAAGGTEAWTKLREEKGLTAATAADGTVTPAAWHAYLCVEGVRTDDGRELVKGAGRYPDMPISLRLLLEDEGGHWGAVTCGRIDTIAPHDLGDTLRHYAEGEFGSDPNGQLGELLVEEQTQRFVSIDPRDVTCEWITVEVEVSVERYGSTIVVVDDDGEDVVQYDSWMRVTDYVIGASTIVPMPAFPQAVITLASVPLPESPIADESAPDSVIVVEVDPNGAAAEGEAAVAASAADAPVAPPLAWFGSPGFHVGDPRLVPQPEGGFACPFTITDDGEVLGHMGHWRGRHTGFRDKKVSLPRSATNYSFFRTGAVRTAEGETVAVGQITAGCGHATTQRRMSYGEVVAHYDGGYGAVQVADVAVGEDDFGVWVHGALRPGLTDEQVREFRALNLSGDWRELGGKNLELVACLAVPVPGFPVSRALAASAKLEDLDGARAGVEDDVPFALVAAGRVRRVDPVRRLAYLEARGSALERRLEVLELAENERAVHAARSRHGL